MHTWFYLLTPVAALAVLWLLRFAGCASFSAADRPLEFHTTRR